MGNPEIPEASGSFLLLHKVLNMSCNFRNNVKITLKIWLQAGCQYYTLNIVFLHKAPKKIEI